MHFVRKQLSHALNLHLPSVGVRRALMAALVGAAISFFIPIRPAITLGRSMEPALRSGQPFLFASQHGPYKRGDVLVFREDGLPTVKRVAAVGGQALWIVPYAKTDPRPAWALAPGVDAAEWNERYPSVAVRRYVVPAGKLFVVGDSTISSDSRDYGPIDESAVMGRVTWPAVEVDPETWSFFHKLNPAPGHSSPHRVRIARR